MSLETYQQGGASTPTGAHGTIGQSSISAPSVGTQAASMPTISGTTANYSKTKAESWNWTDSSGEMHSSGYNSYQSDFPDLTGWLNQNNYRDWETQQLEAAKKINRASAAAREAVLNELRKTTHQRIQPK